MVSEAQKRAQAKYDAANTVSFRFKLNKKTDADILARLEEIRQDESMQGYIKRLIRQDMGR